MRYNEPYLPEWVQGFKENAIDEAVQNLNG
jgi:hypothetical protein